MFAKDVFPCYLAAGSHKTIFSVCILLQRTCKKIGGQTAPSSLSRSKELRSATGIVSADGREESTEELVWDIPIAV